MNMLSSKYSSFRELHYINDVNNSYLLEEDIDNINQLISDSDYFIKLFVNDFLDGYLFFQLIDLCKSNDLDNRLFHIVFVTPSLISWQQLFYNSRKFICNKDSQVLIDKIIVSAKNIWQANFLESCVSIKFNNILIDIHVGKLEDKLLEFKASFINYFNYLIGINKPIYNLLVSDNREIVYPVYYSKSLSVDEITQIKSDNINIAVIGAGIAGLNMAYQLIDFGFTVDLYDRQEVANGASGNLFGLVYPQIFDDDVCLLSLYQFAYHFANNLYIKMTEDFDLLDLYKNNTINLYINKNVKFNPLLDKIFSKLYKVSLVSNKYLIELDGGVLQVKKFIQQMVKRLQERGLNLYSNREVLDINPIYNDNNISGHEITSASLDKVTTTKVYPWIVATCGFEIKDLSYCSDLFCYPVRGQVSIYKVANDIKFPICYKGYLIPINNNQVLLGATHQRGSSDLSIKLEDDLYNLNLYQKDFPLGYFINTNINDLLSSRCSIRSAMRDRFPLIGSVSSYNKFLSNYNGLYEIIRRKKEINNSVSYERFSIIAALSSRGLTTAPIAANIVIRNIIGLSQIVNDQTLHKLHPDRQYIRRFSRGNYNQ